MAGGPELGGVHGFDDSGPPRKKETHRRAEKLTANSPGYFSKAEEQREKLAACGGGRELRWDLNPKKPDTRARINELGDEKGPAGLIYESYRGIARRLARDPKETGIGLLLVVSSPHTAGVRRGATR